MLGRKKERPTINGVPLFPEVSMREAGSQYGMIFVFLILPFYGLLIPLMAPEAIFPPDMPIGMVLLIIGFIAMTLVAVESVGYYAFQRWLQSRVSEAVYLKSRTKIGKYEMRECLRVVEVVVLAEPKDKKVPTRSAESAEEAARLAEEERKLVLLPAFKTLRIGKHYMYHIAMEEGVGFPLFGGGKPARFARILISPYPWEELDFRKDPDLFEYGFFLTGRSTELNLVHIGYMYSVLADDVVPVFYIYLSEPHKREILASGFKLPETADIKELLKYVHEADKHQAQEVMLLLKEVERERDLYKERYEALLSSQLEVAEDMAAEIITIWLEGIESTEKLFGKTLKEKVKEKWGYIAVIGGVLLLLLLALLL